MFMWKHDVFISGGNRGSCKGFVDQLSNTCKQTRFRANTVNYHPHKVYGKSKDHDKLVDIRKSKDNHKLVPIVKPQTGCLGNSEKVLYIDNSGIRVLRYPAVGLQYLFDKTTKHSREAKYENFWDKYLGAERRLSIFWDIENSPIPADVIPEDIVENIVATVRRKTKINWKVDAVYAYGDFSIISKKQKVKLHNSGVTLIDTPRLKKDTTYNALLVALLKQFRDCPPPSSIMLITANIYFANALNALQRFGHDIILAISSEVAVSTPLINASDYHWYWSNVAKGEDLVPTSSSQIKKSSRRCGLIISICPSERRLLIVWDLENCSIPREVHAKDVVKNILAFVKRETKTDLEVFCISAYAEMSRIGRELRAYLQESGVNLIDTPHVKKDAADEAMIVDLFMESYYFPPPSSIMVITGDVDLATTLHALTRFGHDIFLAIPSGVGVSKSLINASKYHWYWSDVANGIEEPSHVELKGLN